MVAARHSLLPSRPGTQQQADLNASAWSSGRFLADYDHRSLEPVEVLIMARYREALSGRVLDVGCGAGRILGYLVELGAEVHGIDISPRMVEHCRGRFPGVDIGLGDLATLPAVAEGPFDAVLLSDNVLDVLDDERRRASLADIRGLLAPAGLLIFSSHNLAHWERSSSAGAGARRASLGSRLGFVARKLTTKPPAWMLGAAKRIPRRAVNRRRLGPLQYRAADHAVVNDSAHDYSLLHYYIGRADQERQLSQCGLRLVDVLEFDGTRVGPGDGGRGASLYYVATSD
ncbi:MAG: class I SAM-dependent methyltransferase [Solirubrobacteraceae bacterium]